jgi:hypothetical protein
MDQNAFDIRRRRRARVENRVASLVQVTAAVGVLDGRHDVRGIDQHDQVLGEIDQGIFLKLCFGEQYRPGFGDRKSRPNDGYVHIGKDLRMRDRR